MSEALFRIHGARGSHPVSGPSFTKYGGHTTSFSLETGQALLLFDAGSGITETNLILAEAAGSKKIALFLTHFHLDHLLGLMGLKMLYCPDSQLDVYGAAPSTDESLQGLLSAFFDQRFWPVPLGTMASTIRYHELSPGNGNVRLEDVTVHWQPIPHTQLCLAYQLHTPGGSITIATDHEPTPASMDEFVEFTRGTDLLIQDAQYTPDEYLARRGWGHGTWRKATEIADRAGVGRLVLTHHDPGHSDDELEAILLQAKSAFDSTTLARDGLAFQFTPSTIPSETAIRT